MRLTTLRVLALVTTMLVIAAGTCIATFGQTPGPARTLPFCSHAGLAVEPGDRTVTNDRVDQTIRIRNAGAACMLQRGVSVLFRDARGANVPAIPPPVRFYIDMVLVPVAFAPGADATFTLGWSTRGTACPSVATVVVAIGSVEPFALPDALTPCTQPDGSNVRWSNIALVSASPAPEGARTRAAGGAASSQPRL